MLYVDGMSAGKTDLGTLDSQDLLLRGKSTIDEDFMGERERANDLCDIVTAWGYDGLVRDEIGFEVIQCDFDHGLEQVSSLQTFYEEDRLSEHGLSAFQWTRAAGQRYDGIGGNRLNIDFSSMVSGFFFPINISSTTDERPDLIRLAAASELDLKDIKNYLQDVSMQPRRFTVHWQGVVDMVVARYADRFALMGSENTSVSQFISELESLTLAYVDASGIKDSD